VGTPGALFFLGVQMIAIDTETHMMTPGNAAPPIVCLSWANDRGETALVISKNDILSFVERVLDGDETIAGANIAFDFAVLMRQFPSITEKVFAAYERGIIFDVQIAEALNAIAHGHHLKDVRRPGSPLQKLNPDGTFGKITNRYSLETCVWQVLGKKDAKANDTYRLRYGELDGLPLEQWSLEARQYPIDDAVNTLEVAKVQIKSHRNLGEVTGKSWSHMTHHCRAALAMHLGSVQGLCVDVDRVQKLAVKVSDEYEASKKRLLELGFMKPDGKMDQKAIKVAVLKAHGADKPCPVCSGTGKVPSTKTKNKINCAECGGTGLEIPASITRTPSGGIAKDRDTLEESDLDELSEVAELTKIKKLKETYLPMLLEGAKAPLNTRANVLLETGRASYEGLVQLLPRKGGVRECFKARDGYYFCSVDYSALELCTLAQVLYDLFNDRSVMAATIRETSDPGSLHTALAARMMNVDPVEFTARYKAKDKEAEANRQSAKCFHPDTEVLTPQGWKKISDVTEQDMLAAPVVGKTSDDASIVWQKPLAVQHIDSTDDYLVHLKNEGIDLLVTGDHRMLGFRADGRAFDTTPEEFNKTRTFLNAATCSEGSHFIEHDLLRLVVATQADGSYSKLRIKLGFSKERKILRMRELLSNFAGEYVEAVHSNGKYKPTTCFTLSRELSARIKEHLDDKKCFDWRLLNLTLDCREVVLDEARYWDSHSPPNGVAYTFCSVIEQNVQVLQAIAAITNRKTRLVREPKSYKLTIRTKNDSRGESISTTRVPYTEKVHCVTMPSDAILVRSNGVVVITRQCGNFGFGGLMGAPKLVLAKRKEGIRFCELAGINEKCGKEKVMYWNERELSAPTCPDCIGVASELRRQWLEQWPEMNEYFAHFKRYPGATTFGAQLTENDSIRTGFVRAGLNLTTLCNHAFQHLAAIGAKHALWQVTKECYVDKGSPLYGSRPILFIHDEIIIEVPIEKADAAARRHSQVMIDAMREFTPDIPIAAEPTLMTHWYKSAVLVKDSDGKLVPWEPIEVRHGAL
jgi:hypothetical protein